MSEYFAATMMKTAINMAAFGVRDLRNPDLYSFYAGSPIPASELATAAAAAQEIQSEAGITPISSAAFSDQAGNPSQDFFIDVMEAMGIELTLTEDITVESGSVVLPDLGFRTAFLKEQSSTLSVSIPTIRDQIRSRQSVNRADIQHLIQRDAPVLADSDPYVRQKLRAMRHYVARYLST